MKGRLDDDHDDRRRTIGRIDDERRDRDGQPMTKEQLERLEWPDSSRSGSRDNDRIAKV